MRGGRYLCTGCDTGCGGRQGNDNGGSGGYYRRQWAVKAEMRRELERKRLEVG
jgi:hypothetical protein